MLPPTSPRDKELSDHANPAKRPGAHIKLETNVHDCGNTMIVSSVIQADEPSMELLRLSVRDVLCVVSTEVRSQVAFRLEPLWKRARHHTDTGPAVV